MITEKDFALMLKEKIDNMMKEKVRIKAINISSEPDKKYHDYKILQQECNKLGFNLYKLYDMPIDNDFYSKLWKKQKAYVIYNDETLKNVQSFYDYKRH